MSRQNPGIRLSRRQLVRYASEVIGHGALSAKAVLCSSWKPSVPLLTSLAVPRLCVCLQAPANSPGQVATRWANGEPGPRPGPFHGLLLTEWASHPHFTDGGKTVNAENGNGSWLDIRFTYLFFHEACRGPETLYKWW